MNLNVMHDLETMGKSNDAAIIELGAVVFDLDTMKVLPRKFDFCMKIDLESAVATGGVIDASTVLWWMRQDNDARLRLDGVNHINHVLQAYSDWMDGLRGKFNYGGDLGVWGNGSVFDNVILKSAYARSGIDLPWSYREDRCYRTVRALNPDVKFKQAGVYHSALDDALGQARHLIKMLNRKEK